MVRGDASPRMCGCAQGSELPRHRQTDTTTPGMLSLLESPLLLGLGLRLLAGLWLLAVPSRRSGLTLRLGLDRPASGRA